MTTTQEDFYTIREMQTLVNSLPIELKEEYIKCRKEFVNKFNISVRSKITRDTFTNNYPSICLSMLKYELKDSGISY